MKFGFLLAAALSLRAQGGLDLPRVGDILDVSTGSVRELRGLAGAFTLGPSKYEGAISMGCSGRICLVKTSDSIVSPSGADGAPPGPAIFGFDRDQALIYFPETRQFARWSSSGLRMLDWSVEGEVLALRPRGEAAELVIRRNGEVWINGIAGDVRGALPSDTTAALLLPSGVVYASDGAVVLAAGIVRSLTVAVQGDPGYQHAGYEPERMPVNRTRQQADRPLVLYELDPTHVVAGAGSRMFLIAVDRGEIFEIPGGDA